MAVRSTRREYYPAENYFSPTLTSSFVNYGAPHSWPGYWKDGNGVVHLTGLIKGNGVGVGRLVAFTLPEGYRPQRNSLHVGMGDAGTSGGMFVAKIVINPQGEVVINGAPADYWVTLDNVQFHTDTSMFTEVTLQNGWTNHTFPKIPRYTYFTNAYAGVHPGNEREMTEYFRPGPGSTAYAGRGTHAGQIAWTTPDTANTKPAYIQADQFAWQAEASFYAPTTGNYSFFIDGDDAVDLWIDDKMVANWYGGHGAVGFASLTNGVVNNLALTAGVHTIKARMEEGAGGDGIALGWTPPGGSRVVMPYGDGSTTTGGLNYGQDNPNNFRNTAGYWKDDEGFVHLKGVVYGPSNSSAMFYLPEEYRPRYEIIWSTIGDGYIARLEIQNDGAVYSIAGQGSGVTEISLDGVIFPSGSLIDKYTPIGAYQNNHNPYGGAFHPGGWYKDRWGTVRFTGLVTSAANGTAFYITPPALRQSYSNRHFIWATLANSTLGRIDYNVNGVLYPESPTATSWVPLEHVKWRTINPRVDT